METDMYEQLQGITKRPEPFEFYTADLLWTDSHVSKKMLEFHLDGSLDLASRNTGYIESSVDWMTRHFDIGEGKSVCDFGCGPGLFTSRFAEAGADVTGIDFSERSIEYARRTADDQGLDIEYVHRNYLQFETDRKYDLVTLIFCDLCPLSPFQRHVLLEKMRGMLAEGGAVLLDVISLKHFESAEEKMTCDYSPGDGFWSLDPYYAFVNSFKYDDEKLLLDKHTIIERSRTRTIYNWLQCFSQESLRAEFEDCGLEITEYYADVTGNPFDPDSTQFAVVGRKASS